jgi:hypothetical protein
VAVTPPRASSILRPVGVGAALLALLGCAPAPPQPEVRSYTHPPLNVVTAGPAADPPSFDAGAPSGDAGPVGPGSSVPLDAPPTQVAAESPPPTVARNSGTPADKLLVEGDGLFARGDWAGAA